MNEKAMICHDCDGFKWKNINIYSILIVFLCGPMPFLACWIVITPTYIHFQIVNLKPIAIDKLKILLFIINVQGKGTLLKLTN
jgi:hypothetical protein